MTITYYYRPEDTGEYKCVSRLFSIYPDPDGLKRWRAYTGGPIWQLISGGDGPGLLEESHKISEAKAKLIMKLGLWRK